MHSRFAKKSILIILLLQCLDNFYIWGSSGLGDEGIIAVLSAHTATVLLVIGMGGILFLVMRLFFFSYTDIIRKIFILFYSLSIIGMAMTELQNTFFPDDLVNTMQLSRGALTVTISEFIWMLITLGMFLWIYSSEKLRINGHLIVQVLGYIISLIMVIVVIYLMICLISGKSVSGLIYLGNYDDFNTDGYWDPGQSAVRNIVTIFLFTFIAV